MSGAHTTFTNGSTLTDASWFQDVDTVTYTLFGNGTTYTGALTLGSSGNIAVNTNKFTVAASSGNTVIAGTLAVTGVITLSGAINLASGGTPALYMSGDTTSGLYRPGSNQVACVISSAQVWNTTSTGFAVTGSLTCSTTFGCNGATAQAASTGYGTPTNTAKQSSYDATTITLPNLAKAVGALIIDLKAVGFLAA